MQILKCVDKMDSDKSNYLVFLNLIKNIKKWEPSPNTLFNLKIADKHLNNYIDYIKSWSKLKTFINNGVYKKIWSINTHFMDVTKLFINSQIFLESLITFKLITKINNNIYWNLSQRATLFLLFTAYHFVNDDQTISFCLYKDNIRQEFIFSESSFGNDFFSKAGIFETDLKEQIKKEQEKIKRRTDDDQLYLETNFEFILKIINKMEIMFLKYGEKKGINPDNLLDEIVMNLLYVDDVKLKLLHYLYEELSNIREQSILGWTENIIFSIYQLLSLYITIMNTDS